MMTLCDIVRIDHFRGFESYWEIPARPKRPSTASGNRDRAPRCSPPCVASWPTSHGQLKIIAEDLGIITPPVKKLREDIGLPGMRILHFAFGDDARNPYLPHNYDANTVVYTGTHDNDTTCGWWESLVGGGGLRHPDAGRPRPRLGPPDE
jgi:4-alpha-glucanotransferase